MTVLLANDISAGKNPPWELIPSRQMCSWVELWSYLTLEQGSCIWIASVLASPFVFFCFWKRRSFIIRRMGTCMHVSCGMRKLCSEEENQQRNRQRVLERMENHRCSSNLQGQVYLGFQKQEPGLGVREACVCVVLTILPCVEWEARECCLILC